METPMSYILYFCIAILYTEYVVELLWGGGGGGGVVHGGMPSTVPRGNFGCHINIEPTSVYATAIYSLFAKWPTQKLRIP